MFLSVRFRSFSCNDASTSSVSNIALEPAAAVSWQSSCGGFLVNGHCQNPVPYLVNLDLRHTYLCWQSELKRNFRVLESFRIQVVVVRLNCFHDIKESVFSFQIFLIKILCLKTSEAEAR